MIRIVAYDRYPIGMGVLIVAAIIVLGALGILAWGIAGDLDTEPAPEVKNIDVARTPDSKRSLHNSASNQLLHSKLDELMSEPAELEERLAWMASWHTTFELISDQVEVLRQESIEESCVKLSSIDPYFWPGLQAERGLSIPQLPLSPEEGLEDIHRIMSNRRVLKLLVELRQLDSESAARTVAAALEDALDAYERGYAALVATSDYGPAGNDVYFGGGQVSDNANGEPTFLGKRLRILALVFIAGRLELEKTRPQVLRAVELAFKQRAALSDPSQTRLEPGYYLLRDASIYSRLVLAEGLLGVTQRASSEKLLENCRAHRVSTRLTHYDAQLSTYDQPTWYGAPVDWSKGEIHLTYFAEMTESQLEELRSLCEGSSRK